MPGETGTAPETGTTPVTPVVPAAPAVPKKERKAPVPSSTLIGTWNEDKTVFSVLSRLEDATDKDKADAIRALPFGKYTVLTARETTREYKEVVSSRLI